MSQMSLDAAGAGTTSPAAGVAATQSHRSLGQLVAISIFWFAINFHWAALPLLIIPSQVFGLLLRQAPGATLADQAAWVTQARLALAVALVSAPGLVVALLSNPFFGLWSDRTRSRFGRRRPFVVIGTVINVGGLIAMAFVPDLFVQEHSGNLIAPSLFVLMLGLTIVQFGSNAAQAPFHALLPDLVPQEQRGTASGIMGLAFWLGTITGVLIPTLVGIDSNRLKSGALSYASYQHNVVLAYLITSGVILLMAGLTFLFVREKQWRPSDMAAAERAGEANSSRTLLFTLGAVLVVVAIGVGLFNANIGLSLNDDSLQVLELATVVVAGFGAARAFQFRPRRNPDFSWVVLTRLLVMMGVYIVQVFIFQYMLSITKSNDNANAATTTFIILLTVAATASTLFAGWGSDRIGRKRMVYISGGFMAVVGLAFIFAPYLAPGAVLTISYVAAAIFGLGYGAYVSVDWALVADVLPSEHTFARDMGVWNIGLTLPQVLALVFGSRLIGLGQTVGHPQLGFTFLFITFVLFCLAGTVTVRNIKGVKR
jgi:MFS family permease